MITLFSRALVVCMAMIFANSTAASHRISGSVTGGDLMKLSPVVYYYDSLWKTGQLNLDAWNLEDMPRVVYNESTGQWAVQDAPHPEAYSVPEDRKPLSTIYKVDVKKDILTFHRTRQGNLDISGTIQVKLFTTAANVAILGISLNVTGADANGSASFNFYQLGDRGWDKVISWDQVFPATAAFFKQEADVAYVEKHYAISSFMEFSEGSDEVTITPVVRTMLACSKPYDPIIGLTEKEWKKLCAELAKMDSSKFRFRFDKEQGSFVGVK